MHRARIQLPLFLLLISVLTSGCVLVPFVQAFKETGVSEGDRMALLAPEVKKFSDGVTWGNKMSALEVVADRSKASISQQLKSASEDEHVVESKLNDVAWSDNSYKAKVSLKVKYYRVPFYIVKTRLEEQQWEFSLGTGWKLTDRSVVEG